MFQEWLSFSYRDFYDVPRAIVVWWRDAAYYLYCPLDSSNDDYSARGRESESHGDESHGDGRESRESRESHGDVKLDSYSLTTMVTSYTYDAWGNPITTTGTLAATVGVANPFRYRGYYYDCFD